MELEDRFRIDLKRVERQSGQALTAAFAMGLVAIAASAWAIFGGGSPESDDGLVTARRFVLQGIDGRTRGEWLVEDDGTSRIVLSDPSGGQRMMLTVQAGGTPGLSLSDAAGNRRIVMGLLPDATSTLVFADAAGEARAVLGMSPDERADLTFADQDGRPRLSLGVDREGTSSMMVPETPAAAAPTGN